MPTSIVASIMCLRKTYAEHRGIALSTLGRIGMGSGKFFDRIAEGRVTIRRADLALS